MQVFSLHPKIDHGVQPGNDNFVGGQLACLC
jgi:hypothetical protein